MKKYELECVHNNLSNSTHCSDLLDAIDYLERSIQNDLFYYKLEKNNSYTLFEVIDDEHCDILLEVNIYDYANDDDYKADINDKIKTLKGVD